MIIPPDPEKDPNVFSPSSSTQSLLPPPSESSDIDSITHPERAYIRNPVFGYPFSDDLGVGYNGEALPPYQQHHHRGDGSDLNAPGNPPMRERSRVSRIPPGIIIPDRPMERERGIKSSLDDGDADEDITPRASTSTAQLPFTSLNTPSTTIGSTSKLWESSSFSNKKKGKGKMREWLIPPVTISPKYKRWWKKWRKWVYVILGLVLTGLGLMVGLLVGLRTGLEEEKNKGDSSTWKDISGDGKRQNWVSHGESVNLTYVPSRDGPTPADGNMTLCPAFMPLNDSSPITSLSRPFPGQSASITKFEFPLWKNGSAIQALDDFTFIARGLGSSGTLDFIGQESPTEVYSDGKEGVMTVEVVALYAGQQNLDNIIRVCSLQRDDESLGLGIFTPEETDGKISNAYLLNPVVLPSFHVIVRLPPSSLLSPAQPSVNIPKLSFDLERMGVRFGNLQNVAVFGDIKVQSRRGGLNALYIAAKNIDIRTGDNAVRGRFNVTESILVNNTEASIIAEIILYDPQEGNNTTAAPESRDLHERGSHKSRHPTPTAVLEETTTAISVVPTHSVSTSFSTGEGVVQISYIHQSPRTALSAYLGTGQGEMVVSMHPNYVGLFVIQDVWGQVRIPPVKPIYQVDPMGQGRARTVTYGVVDPVPGGLYAKQCLNETVLEDSPLAVSGAVYWKSKGDGSMGKKRGQGQGQDDLTPIQVQDLDESTSELLVMGSWGDIQVTFDGT